MYLNFKILNKFKEQFSFSDLLYLCAVKQQDKEYQEEYYSLNPNQKLLEQGYIKTLKNGEVRLDKKGTELLKNISKSDEITEDTEAICKWLVDVYKGREDGIVKNKQELKRRCDWFQKQTGIRGKKLTFLLQLFIQDTYTKETGLTINEFKKENPRMVLSNMVDNVFYRPESRYDKHYILDKSPLYTYLEDNKEYINKIWEKYGREN